MKQVSVLALFLLISAAPRHCAKFPSELQKCAFADNDCIKDQMNVALKTFKNGNAALNLPPLEPFQIDSMQIKQGAESPVNIVIDFKKVKLHGISNLDCYKTVGFNEDMDNAVNEFHCKSPRLSLVGSYKINGRVLVLPITGTGQSNLTLDGVDIMYKFNSNAVLKNGKSYLNIKSHKIDFTATRFYINLDNLFNGDKVLSDNMNQFLNDNWEELLKELKPRIAEVFGDIVTQIVNNVFARRPYKDHFLPSPGQT